MRTLSYVATNEEEIEIGEKYYFGQLWDGNGDAEELLKSGSVCVDGESFTQFKIIEKAADELQTVVEVTDIF